MIQAFEHSQFDEGVLFFTSLGSINTISDCILRRIRGLLMVVSLDFTKLELLEDFGSTKSTKNPEPKLVSSKKGKVKKQIPVQRSFKSNSIPEKPSKVCFLVLFMVFNYLYAFLKPYFFLWNSVENATYFTLFTNKGNMLYFLPIIINNNALLPFLYIYIFHILGKTP